MPGHVRKASWFPPDRTVVATFLISLGNKPQDSGWKFTAVIASFALLTCYMLCASAVLRRSLTAQSVLCPCSPSEAR